MFFQGLAWTPYLGLVSAATDQQGTLQQWDTNLPPQTETVSADLLPKQDLSWGGGGGGGGSSHSPPQGA